MSISIERLNELERKMTVTIPAEDISQEMDRRMIDLTKKVKLDGFRKGKVPLKVIKQRYGSVAHAEAVEEAIRKSYFDSVTKEDVKPAGMPEINPGDIKMGEPITYTATFEVFPEIELKDFSSIEIERKHTELKDSDIDAAIEKLRQQRGRMKEITDTTAKNDRVEFSYDAFVNNAKVDSESKDKMSLTIGSDIMLDGFEDALIGKKVNEPFNIDLIFPSDHVDDNLKGKPVQFRVSITKASRIELPEVNQEFISSLGINGGVEDFKAEVKKNLERELKYSLKSNVKKEVLDKLGAAHEIKLPKALVKQEAERLRNQSLNYFKQISKGANIPEIPLEMFVPEAEKNAKLGLLLSEVISKKELVASDELIKDRVNDLAAMYDQPEQASEWIMKDNNQLEQVKAQVLEEMVVNLVLDTAKVTEKQISYEELIGAQQQR